MSIEVIRPDIRYGEIQYALFDFDGTISLIREGWQGIMIPMMVQILLQTPEHESAQEIEAMVRNFVITLTGKQTIYQMIRLAEEITRRGGEPREPSYYKTMYNEQLDRHIAGRIRKLKAGKLAPADMVVPGSLEWLEVLKRHGVVCYLASGTDEKYVFEEAQLLGLTGLFAGIYGAKEDYKTYSKKMVIERILCGHQLQSSSFIAFGDGYVEIEDTKNAGGIAVGLATNERERSGIDTWKRSRLIAAGADLIIPDFSEPAELEAFLFPRETPKCHTPNLTAQNCCSNH